MAEESRPAQQGDYEVVNCNTAAYDIRHLSFARGTVETAESWKKP
jgi:hypothetical protein